MYISNKCNSIEQKYYAAQMFSTLKMGKDISPNPHIIMISKGPRDTLMTAENTALPSQE